MNPEKLHFSFANNSVSLLLKGNHNVGFDISLCIICIVNVSSLIRKYNQIGSLNSNHQAIPSYLLRKMVSKIKLKP